ncbi:UV-B-induced protein At3g17800, chloroplastic-like [Juglans microcarpa x Juglans regia]|uniref:UV-B-induced protein At3g17800, chloroplastic-like n=1 Tax=Juglans microcarpa x Juglans regia TaxID=2249226 RepID=UPI001B7E3B43|nr:UV-B-induced protein At3g17800, chloroplastic-like [Juglans microcarpa x Juglans regia]XP_040998481.1 UV-B-induced protein At3g17800, chloroplastic-like [Juglans microcarpa x Juglans regia]
MEAGAATVVRSPFGMSRPFNSVGRSGAYVPDFVRFGTKLPPSIKHYTSIYQPSSGHRRMGFGNRRCLVVWASSSPDSAGSTAPIAPLQLESPIGQFLSQILISHPHLVPAAVEQQLEQLQTDRDAEKKKEEPSASGTDLVLSRRIAEVKANERRKALEEILYTLVVQKFMDANISLIPTIAPSSSDPPGQVDVWPSQDDKLEQLHSPEAYEMIQNHLALILGSRAADSTAVAQISKLRVGQVYAASVMYGYFLKRVDQRFQLEKTMKILPNASNEAESDTQPAAGGNKKASGEEFSSQGVASHPEISSWSGGMSPGGFNHGIKASRLRNYVMSFDGETLQRYATIRSKEAVSIIEKHTEALFGRPEIVITPQGTVDSSKDELIRISFAGLKRLVLEAATFGSFLWDVESHVDSRYHFVMN